VYEVSFVDNNEFENVVQDKMVKEGWGSFEKKTKINGCVVVQKSAFIIE
jgi:hypothetical protein